MKKIDVVLGNRSYGIVISATDSDLLPTLSRLGLPSQAVIITNRRVHHIAGGLLRRALRQAGCAVDSIMVADAESSKSFAAYERIIRALARRHGSRAVCIAALGGGVIGDLAGFVAATYRRGIAYIQMPTTLLAQIDSAIGGKTAIDLREGKNLVGAFYQPRLVFSHVGLLSSLPLRQLRSGCAEVIKYAVISDPELFRYLESHVGDLLAARPETLYRVVKTASIIKARIVSLDERETTGLRTLLNFGHSVGHALETATGYDYFTHGEAIAIGMLVAADIAAAMGMCDVSLNTRLESLIAAAGLPTRSPRIGSSRILRALKQDKKNIRGNMRWVLPLQIGHVVVTEQVPRDLIIQCIRKRTGET